MKEQVGEQIQHNPQYSIYLNPDWQTAQNHGHASKIGTMTKDTSLQFCTCCFHHIHKQPIPLCEDTKQLQFLGFGFPLYFSFVRHCIFLLLVMVFCYNVPSLYYALVHNQQFCSMDLDHVKAEGHGGGHPLPDLEPIQPKHKGYRMHLSTNDHPTETNADLTTIRSAVQNISQTEAAHQIECTGWMIYLSRIQKQVTVEEQLIRFGSFFVHFILLLYIREKLTKMKYYFDQRSATPSDFAVFIKNMPYATGQRRELERFLKWEYGDVNPIDIILIPDLKVYEQLQSEQQKLFHQLQKQSQHPTATQTLSQIQSQIHTNQSKIKSLILKDKALYQKDELQAQRAILIFNTQDQKWDLINLASVKKINRQGWTDVKITEASEPEEVIWENSCYNNKDKRFFKVLGWLLSILTLVGITVVFGVISHFKSVVVQQKIIQYQKSQNRDPHLLRQAFAMVIGMILLVVLFNKFVLAHLFHKFTEIGKHSSTYKFQFYFCLKYCLGLFFTTALMTLIIQDFVFKNYFKHNFGVIQQQTIMFLFNSTFVPILWLINPTYQFHKLKRCRNYGNKHLTQKNANNLMEDPHYDIGKRYGEVLEIMWFTFLYMTLVPIGGVFSCIGLIAYYWVDKYNLLRRSTISSQVSGDLIDLTITMLQFTIVLRVLGEMLFDYQLRGGVLTITWAYLAIAVLYLLLPAELFLNIVSGQHFFNQKMTFSEAQDFFKNTYKDVHILFNRLDEDHQKILQHKKSRKQLRNAIHQKQQNQKLPQKREQARIITKA